NKDINQLEKQNKRLLTKFYTSIDNQTWDSTSEVKKLIDKTNLSTNEKNRLKLYFEQRAYLETRLNDRYQKFDNSIENQNKELKILTSKIEKIYQKHGITKEVLKTYYAKKTVRAD
ncbi:TPA: chromosome assembly protein, partial [Streptococcus agalactiae]